MSSIGAVGVPAAGAPQVQILIATLGAGLFTAALLWLVHAHRSGRTDLLRLAGAGAAWFTGLAPWAALPVLVASAGLVMGGFGVFWDISLHIDEGRDVGPLANPSHYPILFCLWSLFAAGVLSVALHEDSEEPSRRPLRLPGGLTAPVGGGLLLLCGAMGLSGFPLDDLWHRMFGQDVTLWGPTHLVMINGAILSVPAIAVLTVEARKAQGRRMSRLPRSLGERLWRLTLPATLLFAVSFWATEFDWGVPQYRMVWQPLLLAAAAGISLTAARLWVGPGGALSAAGMFLVMRLALTLIVGGLGQTMPALPLFLAEALCVELVARRRGLTSRPVAFGLSAGALCGAAGFAAQYGWSQVVAPYPWTSGLIDEGLPTALLAGAAGGVLGGLLGAALQGELPPRPMRRRAALAGAAVLVVLGANALVTSEPGGVRAQVALDPASGGEAYVTARLDGAQPSDPEWFTALAWQGGGRVVANMRPLGDGRWRSDRPLPLDGEWKSGLRLHEGRTMMSIALHLPRDPAVPHPGVSRPASFSADFRPDREIMQTERRDYVPGWIWTPAALVMLMMCGLLVTALAAGLARALDGEPSTEHRALSARPWRLRLASPPGR